MNTVLISYCYEYELNWGSKPDGFIIAIPESLEAMKEHIKSTHELGSYEYFWRYREITEVFCDDTHFDIIKAKMNDKGLAFFENSDEKNLCLYKKL